MNLSSRLLMCVVFFCLIIIGTAHAATVGKWRRQVITLPNDTYSGNPFELEIDGTFTHTASGTSITLPGYYAGNNSWKIAFMPTITGEWAYVTSSNDSDLNGVTGSITCTGSGLLGMLKGDTDNPQKWKYSDGPYVVPIGVFVQIMLESSTTSEFMSMADFLSNNKIQLVNFHFALELQPIFFFWFSKKFKQVFFFHTILFLY